MKAQPTKNLGDTVKTVLREMCVCVCACVRVCVHALTQLLSHIQLFATPWIVACQAPLSMEFSRWEYWSGLRKFHSNKYLY